MKRCWAYQAIAGSRSAWVPCVRMAEEGSRFCVRHARAIEGAVLGALMHAEASDQTEAQRLKEGRVFKTEGSEVRTPYARCAQGEQSSRRKGEGKRQRGM